MSHDQQQPHLEDVQNQGSSSKPITRLRVLDSEKEILLSRRVRLEKLPKNSNKRNRVLENIVSDLKQLQTSNAVLWSVQRVSKWYRNHSKTVQEMENQEEIAPSGTILVRALITVDDQEVEIPIRSFRRSRGVKIPRLDQFESISESREVGSHSDIDSDDEESEDDDPDHDPNVNTADDSKTAEHLVDDDRAEAFLMQLNEEDEQKNSAKASSSNSDGASHSEVTGQGGSALSQQIASALRDKTGIRMREFVQDKASELLLDQMKNAATEGSHPISLSGLSRALHRPEFQSAVSRKRKRGHVSSAPKTRNRVLSAHPFHLEFEPFEDCCSQQCLSYLQDSPSVEGCVLKILQAPNESVERAAMIDALVSIRSTLGHHICSHGAKALLAISASRHRKWCLAIDGNFSQEVKDHARKDIPPSNKLPDSVYDSVKDFVRSNLVDVPERDCRYWPQHVLTLDAWVDYYQREASMNAKAHVFRQVLREEEFRDVHPMPKSWWKCSTCVRYAVQHEDLRQMKKKTSDTTDLDQQIIQVEQTLDAHIHSVTAEWQALKSITHHVRQGLWWDGTPKGQDDYVLVLQVDHKNHVTVPKLRQSPQRLDMLDKMAVRIYGIVNDTTDNCHLLLYNDELDGQFWKHVISMLSYYLDSIEDVPPQGHGRRHLSIRFDNCSKENKNHFVMNWGAHLVATGHFDSVGFHCPPVGHTKDKADRKFGVFSRLYHLGDVISMHDCAKIGSSIKSTSGVICPSHVFYNWEEYLKVNFRDTLPGILKHRHFLVEKVLSPRDKLRSVQLKWKSDWTDEWEDPIQLFPKPTTTTTRIRGKPSDKLMNRLPVDQFADKLKALDTAKRYVPEHLRVEYDEKVENIKKERAKFQNVQPQKKGGSSAVAVTSKTSVRSRQTSQESNLPTPTASLVEASSQPLSSLASSTQPAPSASSAQTSESQSAPPRLLRVPVVPGAPLELLAGGHALIQQSVVNRCHNQGGLFKIDNFGYRSRPDSELRAIDEIKHPGRE